MRDHDYYVYIMSSNSRVLYIGVTSDLIRRVLEHKSEKIKGFSSKYKTKKLVYFEHTDYIDTALEREKQLKRWRREKKINLIKTINPNWEDLYNEL